VPTPRQRGLAVHSFDVAVAMSPRQRRGQASSSASPNDVVDLLGVYGGTSLPDTLGPDRKLTLR
jgi:hypothetical protein